MPAENPPVVVVKFVASLAQALGRDGQRAEFHLRGVRGDHRNLDTAVHQTDAERGETIMCLYNLASHAPIVSHFGTGPVDTG
ncbi:hypothetical protein GCM10010407_00480 [Rarobacter incanus]